MTTLAFQRLHDAAKLPTRAHEFDAGLDLASVERWRLGHGETALVDTGVAVAIPPGFVGIIKDRSGWAMVGTETLGGVIDAGFTGSIKVVMHNLSFVPREIEVGDRIAQLIVVACRLHTPTWVAELPASSRGDAGFGSSDSEPVNTQ